MNPILFEKSEMRISERGISLIELIMFIVIVSVALAGILLVMNVTTKSSADPLVHKQALAVAESLLEEVELMPFTYCDPDDLTAATAASAVVGAGACTATVEAIGPETGETRYTTTPFDNVNDYNGCQMNTVTANAGCDTTGTGGIRDINNNAIGPTTGYRASIAVAAQAVTGIAALDGNGTPQALLITVTVTGPDNVPVVLEGIRTRYSPKAVP
jgi:MSHA pilin protein MshD